MSGGLTDPVEVEKPALEIIQGSTSNELYDALVKVPYGSRVAWTDSYQPPGSDVVTVAIAFVSPKP